MKVFIGNIEIAGFIHDWKFAFESLGYKVTTLTEEKNPYYDYKYDYNLNEIKERLMHFRPARIFYVYKKIIFKFYYKYLFYKIKKRHDLFIFFGKTFFENYEDLKILKEAGKKIIFVFVGDEIRYIPSANEELKKFGLPCLEYAEAFYTDQAKNNRLKLLRAVTENCNVIYGQPNYMQLSTYPYKFLFVPIQIDKYLKREEQRKTRPLIVHAPSDSKIKGTTYVLNAIEELKAEGLEFDFKLVKGLSNVEALNIYSDADIIVDQLFIPGGGKFSLECLAMGKVVLSSMGYDRGYNLHLLEIECPIVDVSINNIKDKIRSIVLDYKMRTDLALKARPYMEKYHNPLKIANQMVSNLSLNKI